MKLSELLEQYRSLLQDEREAASRRGQDVPVTVPIGRRISTTGGLHLYDLELAANGQTPQLMEDLPVTILPGTAAEPTEGWVVEVADRHVGHALARVHRHADARHLPQPQRLQRRPRVGIEHDLQHAQEPIVFDDEDGFWHGLLTNYTIRDFQRR